MTTRVAHISLGSRCSLAALSGFAKALALNLKLEELRIEHSCNGLDLSDVSLEFAKGFKTNRSLVRCSLQLESLTGENILVIGSAFAAKDSEVSTGGGGHVRPNKTLRVLELLRPSYAKNSANSDALDPDGVVFKKSYHGS